MVVHANQFVDKVAELSLITTVHLVPASPAHRRLFVLKLLLQDRLKVMNKFLIDWILLEVFLVVLN